MKKPALSFWQIWNMCFGFMGIQFGFALQNANVSRIFQSLGASVDELPILWLAAPVTGLLVQPIIGYWSDRTWNKLGRRKPYFLYGALLATAALIVMPDSPTLWIAAGLLWILDASINVSMEPFRALVGDMLNSKQRALGYSMQSWFIGIGAIIASALPWVLTNWFDVANVDPDGGVPDSVRWSFYIGGIVFIAAVGWTIVRTREYPPEVLNSFDDAPPAADHASDRGMLRTLVTDVMSMPKVMQQLAVVQFLTWFALFSMWIYTTPGVTAHHYGAIDTASSAYADGADWVGVLFAVYNGVAALAALLLAAGLLLLYRWYLRYEASVIEMRNQSLAIGEHVMVSEADATGRIIDVNDSFLRACGYARHEVVGQDHRMFNSGRQPPELYRELWETISAGRIWRGTLRNRAKSGAFYWVSATIIPFKDAWGRTLRHVALYSDISGAVTAARWGRIWPRS